MENVGIVVVFGYLELNFWFCVRGYSLGFYVSVFDGDFGLLRVFSEPADHGVGKA